MSWVPAPLRSWWHYQAQMYDFNTGLSTPHTYQSNPWSWLVQAARKARTAELFVLVRE